MRIGSFSFQSAAGTARSALPLSPSADGRMFVYPAQYYPNAATPAQATVISLKSGEERAGVNLQLRLVPTVRISGIVTGPDGPVMTNLALLPSGDELAGDAGLELATSVSGANGRFTFLGVPSGQYLLRVMKRAPAAAPLATLWASDRVSVGATDISDLVVTLRPAVRLSGASVFKDGSGQPAPEVIRQVIVAAESVDGRLLAAGQLAADGRFTTVDLVPGAYFLRVVSNLPGWTFESAMLDGRDISNVPVVVDRSLSGVVVAFTARPSEVNGRVLNATGAADPTAAVLVFPADSTAWIDQGFSPRRLRAVRVDKGGAFRTAGLPPGDYLVAAIPDEASANAFDPRILLSLSRLATPVTLASGESRSLSLKTLAVPR